MPSDNFAPWLARGWVNHTQLMLDSYRRWLGRELLLREGSPEDQARELWFAPFVVVSHNTEADPILNYANRTALTLWETDADTLLQMPSRLTAEPVHRDERARMMARTTRDGFVDDYQGIRISSTGRRFHIAKAIVWNLIDANGSLAGQAATFDQWKYL